MEARGIDGKLLMRSLAIVAAAMSCSAFAQQPECLPQPQFQAAIKESMQQTSLANGRAIDLRIELEKVSRENERLAHELAEAKKPAEKK